MIAVSYLKSIYNKEETIKKIDESIADLIHVDLMDGIYVPSKNFETDEVLKDLKNVSKKTDIHLMVNEPLKYIKKLVNLNIWAITIHLKTNSNIEEVISYLHNHHILAGIAINPNEDIHLIDKYLDKIDYVLVMGVAPGKGGQKFIPATIQNIKYLQDKNVLIGLDGGVSKEMMLYLKDLRIDNLVSGSFICMNNDFNLKIKELL